MNTTKLAKLFGIVFLLIGILGFIPALTPDGNLLGIFAVNTVHNVIHIVTGVVALYCASNACTKGFFKTFGIIYAVVAVLGILNPTGDLLGLVAHNHADMYLHIVIAVVALYVGFAGK